MNDDRKAVLVPDRRVVSLDEARDEKYDAKGKRKRPPANAMQAYVTREEMLSHLPKAALAVGDKIYAQLAEESQKFLQEMESALRSEFHQLLRNEFERRTMRGRWRAFVAWLRDTTAGGYLIELGVLDPAPTRPAMVDAVDVLDPNVQAAVAKADEEPLRWREFDGFGDPAMAFMESGGIALLPAKNGETHAVAKDNATIRRAAALLKADSPIADDVIAVVLLGELLDEARGFCETSNG